MPRKRISDNNFSVASHSRRNTQRDSDVRPVEEWTLVNASVTNANLKTSTPKRNLPSTRIQRTPGSNRLFKNVDDSHLLSVKELCSIFSPARNKGK